MVPLVMNGRVYELEDATCMHETPKAILVCCAEIGDVWIPKSVIHEDSEVQGYQDVGLLTCAHWYAAKQGWTTDDP